MPRIGLISDTHLPDRWRVLPPAVFDLLAGVDVLLHAGDVGELRVLDELSRIAPVIAVHGNDETDEAQAALPYLQTVVIAGQRLVLTHSHYPDRAAEMASRTNPWQPKWERLAGIAHEHGAEILVFGHWHIPICQQQDGVLLINPGGIASGNHWLRQIRQTVAVLTLEAGQAPVVTHYDLATCEEHTPVFDAAGFNETMPHYNAQIVDDLLYSQRVWLYSEFQDEFELILSALRPLCFECWDGRRDAFSLEEFALRLREQPLPAAAREKLRQNPHFARYF